MLSRRNFILGTSALCLTRSFGASSDAAPLVRFGLVTDCHYSRNQNPMDDECSPLDRHYMESVKKLERFVARMNEMKVDFVAELGDFKDNTYDKDSGTKLKSLQAIEAVYANFNGPRYHVLGNHDEDVLTKAEFLSEAPNTGVESSKAYYAVVVNGVTFIALDGCYSSDSDSADYAAGNFSWSVSYVPPTEREWLADTLSSASGPVVVTCHQRLDSLAPSGGYGLTNAGAVREILAASKKVSAVFTGHHHVGGVANEGGVPYYSIPALVLGNAADGHNCYLDVAVRESGGVSIRKHTEVR